MSQAAIIIFLPPNNGYITKKLLHQPVLSTRVEYPIFNADGEVLFYDTTSQVKLSTILCTYLIQKLSYIINFVMNYQPSGFSIIVFFHFC